jgi:hypothetical protein
MIKGVRPRTHLLIDLAQFALLVILAYTALAGELTERRLGIESHAWRMLHVTHVASGVLMCATVGLHLYLHLPWIQAQLTRTVRKLSQP